MRIRISSNILFTVGTYMGTRLLLTANCAFAHFNTCMYIVIVHTLAGGEVSYMHVTLREGGGIKEQLTLL